MNRCDNVMNYTQLYMTIINLFCVIFVGFLLRKFEAIDEKTMSGLNKLIFNVLFPIKIMMSFYHVDFGQNLNTKYFLYLIFMFTFHIFLTYHIAKFTNKDRETLVLEANAMSRGNAIIMSFPILSVLYGNAGIVMAGAMVGISQFFYNLYTVGMYESLEEGDKSSKKELLINVMKTPLMIGVFAGVFLYVTHINLFFLEKPMRDLGNTAGTLALLTMGYGLDFKIDLNKIKSILKVCFVKLLVLPITGLIFSRLFGLSEIQNVVSLIIFGASTAVNTFVFAKKYNKNASLAGYYVVSTTLLYFLSLILLVKLI